ncbi:MAG: hypothetical protein LIO74_08640 [Ruminococcus sp.]|nr:hypothetical protein [Ruminococcus sp.]
MNCGFTDNNNPDLGQLINCTAINNGGGGNSKPNFSCYRCTDCDFDNLLSYYDTSAYLSDANLSLGSIANDKYVGTYCNGIYYNSGYYLVDEDTAVTNGEKIGTKFDGPSDSDFISVDAAPAVGEDLDALWRSADGTLNPGGFFETADITPWVIICTTVTLWQLPRLQQQMIPRQRPQLLLPLQRQTLLTPATTPL